MSLSFGLVKFVLKLVGDSRRDLFIRACQDPELAQSLLKSRMMAHAKFPFPDRPTTYHDYEKRAEQLTDLPVKFTETTSGSTGAKKIIPYDGPTLKSFENMFLLWAHDLIFHSGLDIQKGKLFMSVSPQIGESLKDDRQYLSWPLRILLSPFLVSGPDSHRAKTGDEFLMKISRDLLRADDLEIISIWSPTYLLSVLDFMEGHRDQLKLPSGRIDWEKVWPELKLISCWTSAGAAISAARLKELFPNVLIQSKGLLLTEAPVTLPWTKAQGQLPLVTETYLEFMDEKNKIFQLHELTEGQNYKVLTTQFNGFYRYNTLDEVKVTGFYFKTPILEFLGRTGEYSDLAGEKLSEKNLFELFKDERSSFIFLPNVSGSLPSYDILIDEASTCDWDKHLRTLYHYDLARTLGQLQPPRILVVKDLRKRYLEFYHKRGIVLGDIKERRLIYRLAEAQAFKAWIET